MTQNSQIAGFTTEDLTGARVKRAQSSLDTFAVIFEDGRGLLMAAVVDENECDIDVKVVPEGEIVPPKEAVCAVDWKWIYAQSVLPGGVKQALGVSGPSLKLTLSGVGTITVAAGMWQGKPFLSFMPYKATK